MAVQNSEETASVQETTRASRARLQVRAIYYAVALLVVLILLFALGNRNFLSVYNLNTIATYSATLFVVAVGQMCTILVGGIDLSVGGVMSLVSVLFVVSMRSIGAWAYPLAMVVGAVVGLVNGNILTRIKIPSFIATLGTGGILASLALLVSPLPTDVPGPLIPLLGIVNGSFATISNLLLISVIVLLLFYGVLRFTTTGRNIFYVGSNIKMSWMSGIDIVKTRNFAFMLSGLAASTAAILLSCGQFGGAPTLGSVYVLNSIAAVVVGGTALTGGTGGAVNTLIGALILGVMENGMTVVGIDAYFQQSILGATIVVSVALTFDRAKYPVIK